MLTLLSKFMDRSKDVDSTAALNEPQEDLLARYSALEKESTDEDNQAKRRHKELAEKLGVKAAFVGDRLLDVLKEEGIQVFHRVKVEQYLTDKGAWKWYKLRNCDREDSLFPLYTELVPWEVLVTVEKLLARIPDAHFLVAALEKDPDPFLGVGSMKEGCFYIIERWDEPGFRS